MMVCGNFSAEPESEFEKNTIYKTAVKTGCSIIVAILI